MFDAENKPGVSNLMSILSAADRARAMDEIAAEFDGKGYGDFKDAVADSGDRRAGAHPERTTTSISADKAYLQQRDGFRRASARRRIAHKTMLKVRKKLGIAPWKL